MFEKFVCIICVYLLFVELSIESTAITKRALQKEHEKEQTVKWAEAFFGKFNEINYQLESLVALLHKITDHLDNCTVMILYDSSAQNIDEVILQKLFKNFPLAYVHGHIDSKENIVKNLRRAIGSKCVSYMLFLQDVMRIQKIIGKQIEYKVIIISRSSQWRVHEFLASDSSRNFVNLLVISKSEQLDKTQEIPYILYTHKMYTDGLGSSQPHILMSWYKNKLTKPNSPIFPKKIIEGFAGHRFIVAVADQPPFVTKRGFDGNDNVKWDGIEIRLTKFLSERLNFTIDFQEASEADVLGSSDAVAEEVRQRKVNLGLSGMYVTKERMDNIEMSHGHSHDCAAFISLTSTALPRYRAIMGPFQWTVWLALTFTYLLAILPLSYSDRLTLSHLCKEPKEIENMFWYVFGTFTNCFTFAGNDSWSKSEKLSTRLFIGWYWVFTIIISACYTGSIIAFVTLPVFPTTVDSVQQLINGRYQIGTLDKDGWKYWFQNSTDKKTNKLFKHVELLPDVESGLKNISKAFFWPYAFLGSRDQLDYIVRTNFTTSSKRSVLHISTECFVPFSVSVAFPKSSVYKNVINDAISRIVQSGLLIKIRNDVEWDIMRSVTGKLLQANSIRKVGTDITDDRALSLQDTQGMFLLLGAGFLIGVASLISEWLGGCIQFCKTGKRNVRDDVSTINRSFHVPTPNEKRLEELQFNECESADRIYLYNNTPNQIEYVNSVIVHNNVLKTCENTNNIGLNQNGSVCSTDDELESEINRLFNYDDLFGESNLLESTSDQSEYFGEIVHNT